MPDSAGIQPIEEKAPTKRGSVGPRSIRGRLAAGVVVIIPIAVTVFLISFVYDIALRVGVWLVYWFLTAVYWALNSQKVALKIDPVNAELSEKIVAILLTVATLYVLGWLGSNVVGRRIIDFVESFVERIPLVDTIYGSIKRMVRALSGAGKSDTQKRVVLVDFPHENMKAIAFMTNTITDLNSGEQLATVYVPTTPNPTSGYMEIVPMDRITMTDWTMEEALSMILSGGASSPSSVRLVRGFAQDEAQQSSPAPMESVWPSRRH